MWEILQSSADWDCFRILILREIWKIQNPLLEEHYVSLEVTHLFQQVGCARNKHQFLTVQQNLKFISLDTGLRLDGLPALELWDLIVSVLGNVSRVSDNPGRPVIDAHKRQKSQSRIDVMKDTDLVPSNVQSANHEALLYVFEDNEPVIKMIMKRQKSDDETCFPDPQSCS